MMSVALLFFTGYVARPLGGLLAGHFGDHYGRKLLFLLTLDMMSLATLAIGLLPDYGSWGQKNIWILALLRIVQGMSLGGSYPALPYLLRNM